MEQLLRATARAEARHFWFRGFRRFVTPLVVEAIGSRTAPRILDCGCGTGANVEFLARFGRTYGFDLSAVGLRIGHQSGRARLARASVTAAPFPTAAFDLVTSFDVLYSLPDEDERAAVTEMYRLVRPGGFVLINVAAMEALRGNHSVLSREVRRYSRDSLERLVAGAGFSIVRLTYSNATMFLPLAAIRAVQRWRGLATETDADAEREISVPPAAVNAVGAAILFLESVWIRRFDAPFGSSLICLARKPEASAART